MFSKASLPHETENAALNAFSSAGLQFQEVNFLLKRKPNQTKINEETNKQTKIKGEKRHKASTLHMLVYGGYLKSNHLPTCRC